ncbi:uncharacterized protein KY384_001581 [Bacidia gigantensis]|uniref:uncharacterized protein n=1 Tax=Bacidia gigantensis TaxID=2732470 RepID=UPI001D046E47|nr:uncharacterized protein KY384_001581 [Bacidia gigantensis]KAG8533840.1 hypothetical protein KY384_001581 [Bacidia gigantensis]
MDAFRLLTRSTNLPRAQQFNTYQKQSIPSAATLPKIEGFSGEGSDNVQPSIPRGKKRKRRTGAVIEQKVQKTRLERPTNSHSLTSTSIGRSEQPKPVHDGVGANSAPTSTGTEESPLLQDECRKIMRKHKLKVVALTGQPNRRTPKDPSRSSSESSSKRDKNGREQLCVQPLTAFTQLRSTYGISRRLYENILAQGYQEPTEVQIGSMPLLMGSDQERGLSEPRKKIKKIRSDIDLLTVAPTGSGKTSAFLVPTLQALLDERHRTNQIPSASDVEENAVRVLVVAPTHELVDQIVNEGRKLAAGTRIKVAAMRKGMTLQSEPVNDHQERKSFVNTGDGGHLEISPPVIKADVVVSTPLLLMQAISAKDACSPGLLPLIRHLILDEADILLDPLFRDQTLGIWNACTSPALRTSLWSATMNSSVESLAQQHLLSRRQSLKLHPSSPPHYILRLVVGLKDSSLPTISHRLVYSATERGKLLALRQLLNPSLAPSASTTNTHTIRTPFLVFTQTIPRATALYNELLYDIPPEAGGSSRIAVLHSELSDLTRSNIMAGVRKGEIWVLITTDLLARGVDFRGMNGVVNYDIPTSSAAYVHRAGRTGRQGRAGGVVVTLYTREDIPYVKGVANVIAASDKAHAGLGKDGRGEEALSNNLAEQQWLLDALPDVSKKKKQELKRKGVESRRRDLSWNDPKGAKKSRISTKSGYDRKVENRRKGAARRSQEVLDVADGDDDERDLRASAGEWEGFGD